jgi:flagellar protein FlaG
MEISSYTSNVQPYGSQSGTKIASENDGAKSNSAEVGKPNRLDETARKLEERQVEAAKAAQKMSQERERISEEQREKIVAQMQEFVSSINKGLSFRLDQESGRDVVTIYEADTGDVIRQIPEEEMLEVLRRLAQERDRTSGLLMTKV